MTNASGSPRVFLSGGAGFIGSHFVDYLMANSDSEITIFDNFSSGSLSQLKAHLQNRRLRVVTGDLQDLEALKTSMAGQDVVYHFAANPDIAKAVTQPDIDFWQGTYLTQNLLEAMRVSGVPRLVYASGSGIYGDTGLKCTAEDYAPLTPISTYGASKLACEALISAYCHMFGLRACMFRFANVVGPRQTHGVGYDFIRRLADNPLRLRILGNGKQSKSYIYVTDIVAAVQLIFDRQREPLEFYNVATDDHIEVGEIAQIAIDLMKTGNTVLEFSGGDRGWKGDVPIVRLDASKIKSTGWKAAYTSHEAIRESMKAMMGEIQP
jgi:UDP-glucose 4-epimerase